MELPRELEEGRWDSDHPFDGDDDADSLLLYEFSCGPKWTFLPVPPILVAYRLRFLEEVVELLPGGGAVGLKRFTSRACG